MTKAMPGMSGVSPLTLQMAFYPGKRNLFTFNGYCISIVLTFLNTLTVK